MAEIVDERLYFRVTDLKEYTFCPRVLYYEACLPNLHRETVKTEAGRRAHERERGLARRRTLAAYGIEEGERLFNVPVRSEELGMLGEIDEVIVTPKEAFPVDYKDTSKLGYHFKLQLAAYGLMLAETLGKRVRRGFFYVIPRRRAEELPLTPGLVRSVKQALAEMHRIADTEYIPQPTKYRGRCPNCKYRRFCNDV